MSKRILLCDDEIHILRAAEFKFKRAGYEVVLAGDGEEGWERIQEQIPDIVITDCQMPRLSGLGLAERITECFDVDQMIPAPAQGALALEIRESDGRLRELLAPLDDEPSAYAVLAERSCLAALGGGCSVPIGVHAQLTEGRMTIMGVVLTADGTRTARMRWSGPMRAAREIGETLAELLVSIGADKIIRGEPMPPTMRFANRPPKDFVDDEDDLPPSPLRRGPGTNGASGKG